MYLFYVSYHASVSLSLYSKGCIETSSEQNERNMYLCYFSYHTGVSLSLYCKDALIPAQSRNREMCTCFRSVITLR